MTSTGDELDFAADENRGMSEYTFAEKVKARADELGVVVHQRPVLARDHAGIFVGLEEGMYFDGRLPTVIRRLNLDQLSALYSLYSNWFGYLSSQTQLCGAERSESIRQKDFMLNHLKTHYRGTIGDDGRKIPEAAVPDLAKTDVRFIVASARYEESNAIFNILEAACKVADQDMKVISREVTIQQEILRKKILSGGFGTRGGSDYDNTGDSYGSSNNQNGATPKRSRDNVQRPGKPKAKAKKKRPGIRFRRR